MGLAQFFCAYYLDQFATLNSVISSGLFWLVTGTISCASFGYWINDYYDQERDIQNKKRPSYIAKLAPITVYIHLIIFVFVALLSGYFMSSWFLILFLFSVLMLFMYSWRLKDIPVIGNVIISLLSFYSIYSIIMLTSSVEGFLILHFSVFSGLVTFCREIIKDNTNEYIIAAAIALVSGGGWFVSKVFNRMRALEDRIDRMPLEYVLKQDYIREMEKMNEEFNLINIKLDKLVEKILSR